MRPIYTITVQADEFTQAASAAFDYKFEGESKFEGWEKPDVPSDFSIGLILGPSGSGKSLLLKQFGQEEKITWDSSKAIVSNFSTPNDAINRLMAVGLNSIPSWCRPFHVLSNGEQFRANLARKLRTGAVIDEFTSVIDRNVAKAASVAMRRYVDREGLKNIVLASCHYDILEWLQPDWYFDTVDGILHDGRSLRRPEIKLRLYPCKRSIWPMFASHHYLTAELNQSCHSYLATAQFGKQSEAIVGFASSIAQPIGGRNCAHCGHGHVDKECGNTKASKGCKCKNFEFKEGADDRKAYREHRTVVLPDFQGLGIGPRISDAIAQFYLDQGKRYFSKTAHVRFGGYRDKKNSGWIPTCKYRKERSDISDKTKRDKIAEEEGRKALFSDYHGDAKRICYSHEFVGKEAA
jgi:GNAT superfamily N-acetyltransferase